MSRLEELLKIADSSARQKAMLDYARSLKADSFRAKKENGVLDEDILTVLIYDAERKRDTMRTQNTGLLVGAVIVTLMVVAAIYLLSRLLPGNN